MSEDRHDRCKTAQSIGVVSVHQGRCFFALGLRRIVAGANTRANWPRKLRAGSKANLVGKEGGFNDVVVMNTASKNGLASTLFIGFIVAIGVGLGAALSNETKAAMGILNWHEECQVEGCSSEELSELYGSYKSECLSEGCSVEELNEEAGGQQYIDGMLEAFLGAGWVVDASSFQSQTSPTGSTIWWYQGCNYTGLMTQQNASAADLPNSFNDKTLALKTGPGATQVAVYTDPNYTGNTTTFFSSVACLTNSFPSFANNIESAKIN